MIRIYMVQYYWPVTRTAKVIDLTRFQLSVIVKLDCIIRRKRSYTGWIATQIGSLAKGDTTFDIWRNIAEDKRFN